MNRINEISEELEMIRWLKEFFDHTNIDYQITIDQDNRIEVNSSK